MQSQRILVGLKLFALLVLVAAVSVWPRPSPAAATGGNSITSPSVGNGPSSLALDPLGNPVISFRLWALKVLHCDTPNCTSGNIIASPDTTGDIGSHTSLALDALGNPVVSYYDLTNGDLKVLHCNDPECSHGGESITSPDTTGDVGYWTSLALDASGYPVVSYDDATNYDLKVLHCNDANCEGGDESIESPDTTGNVGWDPSLALDDSGNPVVSYHDLTNTDLKVLHCNDPNCDSAANGPESITSPDTAGEVGFHPSLALDDSGNPVVSYYDAANGDLKVLHCNDPNCDSAVNGPESITSPDTTGDVGWHTSLALDSSGNPVVSYCGFSFAPGPGPCDDLKVLHCNEPNCAGDNESFESPDTEGDVGSWTSLALDLSGNPVVSYYDYTNTDLKVLHCNDPNCEGVKPPQGDANCDKVVDVVDALFILQYEVGMRDDSGGCPLPPDTLNAAAGDVDKNGVTNVVDALFILQCEVVMKPGANMAFCTP